MTDGVKLTYRDAGVDIDAGNRAVTLMKESVRATYRPGVMGDIGGFGGLFALGQKYRDPVLVSGTDGVGTKLRLAFMMDKHDTIGQDAVAMCVNDILVQGAEPLFFLDYLALGKLNPEKVAAVVGGVARACQEAGCALIGGETAEMAGFYAGGEYDIAGFAVGAVERDRLITGEKIAVGDVLVGLPSTGLHSNGFSLVRKICFDVKKFAVTDTIDELGRSLGEELLQPTRLYPRLVLPLLERFTIKGMVHITGGGFYDNLPRIFPAGCAAEIDAQAWTPQPIFGLLAAWGGVSAPEMYRTFNMGIGMVLVVDQTDADAVCRAVDGACVIGRIVPGDRTVRIEGVDAHE